jgi:colanic acid/amylovoran biosynthesis glycosyltransferase
LATLNQYISSNGLKDHVTFLGLIKHGPELLDLIKKADIFLHPSRVDTNGGKEGIPGTIVEAMASGLPVISTYHAGIPDIITNQETGLLVNEDDSKAIANLIYECYKNKALRSAIGINAKRTAILNLDVRNKTEELIKIYDTYIR